MTKWQPIEMAPKDGTEVLVWDGSIRQISKFTVAGLDFDGHWWDAEGYWISGITHWMPLPEPPTEEGR